MFKKKNEEIENLKIQTKRKEKIKKEYVDIKWVATIILVTFIISIILSFISQTTIPNLSIVFGILITLLFVGIGILFDIIGVAVTTADEAVFHSMNSRKVRGANIAVQFKRNADKVSSFCCDVIGDICGVVSGTAATSIAVILVNNFKLNVMITGLIVTAIISALTIGGKAIGKSFAMNKSDIILYEFAKTISYFYNKK